MIQCKTEMIALHGDHCLCGVNYNNSELVSLFIDCTETDYLCGGWNKEGQALDSVYETGFDDSYHYYIMIITCPLRFL